MISERLGIRPWEQRELLTGDELLEACEYIDAQMARENGRDDDGG